MQYPVQIRSGGFHLFGTFHKNARSKKEAPAILILHGFGGNRIGRFQLYVKISRILEKQGFAVLRFDFRGCGESEGTLEKTTFLSQLDDAKKAFQMLLRQPEVDKNRIGIIGSSMGGCLALMLAQEESQIASIVLWSAFGRPKATVRQKIGIKAMKALRSSGRLDIGGEYISRRFVEEALQLDTLKNIHTFGCKVLIIHGTEDESIPPSESALIYRAARNKGIKAERYLIKGADHSYSRAQWRQFLFSKTLDWFKKTLHNK